MSFIGSLVDNAVQMGGQALQNRSNRRLANLQFMHNVAIGEQQNRYNTEAWEKQKQYNISMWKAQNKYNSPIEQMARLKEAGLNPHLMYQQGNVGNASPIPTANLANAADVKGYTRAEAKNVFEGFNLFEKFYNLKNTKVATDNVEKQTENLAIEGANKAIEGIQKAFDYNLDKDTRESLVKARQNAADKVEQETQKLKNENYEFDQTKDFRIRGTKAEALSKEARKTIDEWEAKLSKEGLSKSDNIILRKLAKNPKIFNKLIETITAGGNLLLPQTHILNWFKD